MKKLRFFFRFFLLSLNGGGGNWFSRWRKIPQCFSFALQSRLIYWFGRFWVLGFSSIALWTSFQTLTSNSVQRILKYNENKLLSWCKRWNRLFLVVAEWRNLTPLCCLGNDRNCDETHHFNSSANNRLVTNEKLESTQKMNVWCSIVNYNHCGFQSMHADINRRSKM